MSDPSRTERAPRSPERTEVGRVSSISSRGTLTVRAAGVVEEGTILTDAPQRFRGRVVRVFGPVAHPYLSIAPRRALSSPEALALVGAPLFAEVPRRAR